MNSLRGAFLNKFPDYAPSLFSFNAFALQTNTGSNQETQLFKEDNLSKLPKAQLVLINMNKYNQFNGDSDNLRKKMYPQKNYKSLLACQKDYATGDKLVHCLQILDEVVDNIEQLETINSQDIYEKEYHMRSSTEQDNFVTF